MEFENKITEINVHTGLVGKWQILKYKISLIRKIFKAQHFLAIPASTDKEKGLHIDILLFEMHPADAEYICGLAHNQLQGQRLVAEGANNILNNHN